MKYYQEKCGLYIEMRTSVFAKIQLQAMSEYPNENGGMLAGRYSADKHTVYVEEVVIPVEKTTGRTSFVRKIKGLDAVWETLGKKGLRYIGEWHSHPNGTTQYSPTDKIAMVEIENEVAIGNPILLIVGVTNDGVNAHTFYCYRNNNLLKYKEMIDLRGLFTGLQKQMETSLSVNRAIISHSGSKGDATEQHWTNFLRTYLPDRYKVDKAIVIDSTGNVSNQMDIVIYDGMYTPFIFNQDNFLYIPAESVYAVFEVKQDAVGNIEYAAKKVEKSHKKHLTNPQKSAVAFGDQSIRGVYVILGVSTLTTKNKNLKGCINPRTLKRNASISNNYMKAVR